MLLEVRAPHFERYPAASNSTAATRRINARAAVNLYALKTKVFTLLVLCCQYKSTHYRYRFKNVVYKTIIPHFLISFNERILHKNSTIF